MSAKVSHESELAQERVKDSIRDQYGKKTLVEKTMLDRQT